MGLSQKKHDDQVQSILIGLQALMQDDMECGDVKLLDFYISGIQPFNVT